MEIKYSNHLRFRMRVRQIPLRMPERIYRESTQRYYNHHSLRRIAILDVSYKLRRTLMMIAYDQYPDYVEILTIHTITKKQIRNRLRSGRWTHETTDFEL